MDDQADKPEDPRDLPVPSEAPADRQGAGTVRRWLDDHPSTQEFGRKVRDVVLHIDLIASGGAAIMECLRGVRKDNADALAEAVKARGIEVVGEVAKGGEHTAAVLEAFDVAQRPRNADKIDAIAELLARFARGEGAGDLGEFELQLQLLDELGRRELAVLACLLRWQVRMGVNPAAPSPGRVKRAGLLFEYNVVRETGIAVGLAKDIVERLCGKGLCRMPGEAPGFAYASETFVLLAGALGMAPAAADPDDWRECVLSGMDLAARDLSGALLIGADLSGANLEGAKLSGAMIMDADLSGAWLLGVDFEHVVLNGVDLSGATLIGANVNTVLHDANLSGADLAAADLRQARLFRADLSGADLRGADLAEAGLLAARLDGALVDGATTVQLDQARWRLEPLPGEPGVSRIQAVEQQEGGAVQGGAV